MDRCSCGGGMIKHRVEIFEDNHWKVKSRHMKESDAVFKAYRIHQSRKIDTRVVYKGQIVVAYYVGKERK